MEYLKFFENYAFPVAISAILCAYVYWQGKTHKEEVDKLSSSLIQNQQKMVECVNELTLCLTELKTTLKERGFLDENH